ncbi:MAG: TldD/PmbA family protein [Deltaproteobacteria bacterium]|nr:TldD/PmbA family protein [Deltaproteobacteria bacterium]
MSDLLEMARKVAHKAKARGAQGVQASVYRSRDSELEWRDGKIDRLRESTRMGVGVTLYVDGRYSSNSTSDLRDSAIEHFLDDTVATTRVLAADPHRKLPDPARYASRFQGDLEVFDTASMSPSERRKLARSLEEAARANPDAGEIISVTSSCSNSTSESAMVCSNGMEGQRRRSTFALFAETSVKDEGDRKPEGWWYAVQRHKADLPPIATIGQEATRRALGMRGAKPEKSGQYACAIENAVAGRLLGDLIGPLHGQDIQQKRSFLADRLGQDIGSAALTIVDDPLLPRGLSSRTYDGEGMSTIKRPIFTRGKLETFFLDTYYASKLGKEPTTAGTSNLVFEAGERDLDGLLAAMGTGILITGFSGGNSNPATGDFSIGIRGYWIEKGRRARPLAEMNLAGNHLEFWKKLAEMGKDAYVYSSWRTPSMRFEPVQFSGT